MKFVVVIIAVLIASLGVREIIRVYQRSQPDTPAKNQPVAPGPNDNLPQLTPALEASLQTAMTGGASAMKDWLDQYGGAIADPRKAAIELDYARLLVRSDPGGARRIYLAVKQRTPPGSPVAPRLQQLSRLFE
jgi:hypothetical protein